MLFTNSFLNAKVDQFLFFVFRNWNFRGCNQCALQWHIFLPLIEHFSTLVLSIVSLLSNLRQKILHIRVIFVSQLLKLKLNSSGKAVLPGVFSLLHHVDIVLQIVRLRTNFFNIFSNFSFSRSPQLSHFAKVMNSKDIWAFRYPDSVFPFNR